MKNQMNGLYPIIRRVRRPLVPVVDGAPGGADAKPAEQTKEAPAGAPALPVTEGKGEGEKAEVGKGHAKSSKK